MFDFSNQISDIIFYKNKYGERFALFTDDNIISKQIFISEEFDLEKFYKVINFLNTSKKLKIFMILAQILEQSAYQL